MLHDTEIIAQNAAELYIKEGYFCPEAVVKAIKDAFLPNLSDDILKMATGLHMGVGGRGCLCGALSGAVMSLGLFWGRASAADPPDKATSLAAELYDFFAEKYGFFCCRTIIREQDPGSERQMLFCAEIIKDMTLAVCSMIKNNT